MFIRILQGIRGTTYGVVRGIIYKYIHIWMYGVRSTKDMFVLFAQYTSMQIIPQLVPTSAEIGHYTEQLTD